MLIAAQVGEGNARRRRRRRGHVPPHPAAAFGVISDSKSVEAAVIQWVMGNG